MQVKAKTGDFPLKVELVPGSAWYKNLRNGVPRERWDEIRRATYARYGNKCGICGKSGRLNCHELWEYEDATGVQLLAGFIALCDWCHHVKHLGKAEILASEGKLDINQVVRHFMTVNKCNSEEFAQHRSDAFRQWRVRSTRVWKLNLGQYAGGETATEATREC